MIRPFIRPVLASIAVLAAGLMFEAPAAIADGVASEWVEGFNNKARLFAGRAALPGETGDRLFAAIDIEMPAHWKTYWRTPGDAGGIPPEFDFSASENAKDITVLYPAPSRLIDKTGTTIGYYDHVTFPVAVTPQDPSKPVTLKLKAAYGVCKELCVPAEAELDLIVPPDVEKSEDIADVLKRVPRATPIPETDPVVEKWRVEQRGGKPVLIIDIADPAIPESKDAGADAVVDTANGVYLPLPKKVASDQHRAKFEVDLTDGASAKELVALPVRIVVIGGKGQSETAITLP